jgi:hypothetical protein
MAPHYSRMSIGTYYKKIEEAQSPIEIAAHRTLAFCRVISTHWPIGWGLHCKFPTEVRAAVPIIFRDLPNVS